LVERRDQFDSRSRFGVVDCTPVECDEVIARRSARRALAEKSPSDDRCTLRHRWFKRRRFAVTDITNIRE
jgi:hypothetical protein